MRIFLVTRCESVTHSQIVDMCADVFFTVARPDSQTDDVTSSRGNVYGIDDILTGYQISDTCLECEGVAADERSILIVRDESYAIANDLNLKREFIKLPLYSAMPVDKSGDMAVIRNSLLFIYSLSNLIPVQYGFDREYGFVYFVYNSTYKDLVNIDSLKSEGMRNTLKLV